MYSQIIRRLQEHNANGLTSAPGFSAVPVQLPSVAGHIRRFVPALHGEMKTWGRHWIAPHHPTPCGHKINGINPPGSPNGDEPHSNLWRFSTVYVDPDAPRHAVHCPPHCPHRYASTICPLSKTLPIGAMAADPHFGHFCVFAATTGLMNDDCSTFAIFNLSASSR